MYLIEEPKDEVLNQDITKSMWYRCQCGVIFQKDKPEHNYNKDYIKNYVDSKKYEARSEYGPRIFAPIIEDLTYGRMMLDVGFNYPNIMNYFKDRGWITWGIERNPDAVTNKNIYKGDFETHDFSLPITPDAVKALGVDKIERTFDLIWMSHVIEHFDDPIKAIRKAYNLLSDTGVLYISTPDIEFIHKTGVGGWGHWKAREHNILWSEPALKRELERAGFKVVYCKRNFASRFNTFYDIQIIAQKNYY